MTTLGEQAWAGDLEIIVFFWTERGNGRWPVHFRKLKSPGLRDQVVDVATRSRLPALRTRILASQHLGRFLVAMNQSYWTVGQSLALYEALPPSRSHSSLTCSRKLSATMVKIFSHILIGL